jgi:hypothetical protein
MNWLMYLYQYSRFWVGGIIRLRFGLILAGLSGGIYDKRTEGMA